MSSTWQPCLEIEKAKILMVLLTCEEKALAAPGSGSHVHASMLTPVPNSLPIAAPLL